MGHSDLDAATEGDKVLVIDVNSTNGTIINGHEIKAMDYVELPIGGEIVFGKGRS